MTVSHHHKHWVKQWPEQQDSSWWHMVKGLSFRMEIEAETPGIICVQGRNQILFHHINILTALKWWNLYTLRGCVSACCINEADIMNTTSQRQWSNQNAPWNYVELKWAKMIKHYKAFLLNHPLEWKLLTSWDISKVDWATTIHVVMLLGMLWDTRTFLSHILRHTCILTDISHVV